MDKVDEKYLTEDFKYIINTLSRTNRKNYENYVVNAVYHRLNIPDLKPVSQAFIRKDNNSRYFIDLYFPQINVGIECNEGHHKKQIESDKIRKFTIFDLLNQVGKEGYKQYSIDVYDRTLAEVDQQINDVVELICKDWNNLPEEKKHWKEKLNPAEYFKDKDTIKIEDDIMFKTESEIYKVIFGTDNRDVQRSWFYPRLNNGELATNFTFWAPKLAVRLGDKTEQVGIYKNVLSEDMETITESRAGIDMGIKNSEKALLPRITFAKVKNPVTGENGFKFIGVFKYQNNHHLSAVYKRISTKFNLKEYKF